MSPTSNEMKAISFSEEEIQALFGCEAAEDEDPERLQEYYFKRHIYAQVTADVPLRVLVAHKGIGKSALFNIAIAEDEDSGRIPVLVRPDDVADIDLDADEFLGLIKKWKDGLLKKILSKLVDAYLPESISIGDEKISAKNFFKIVEKIFGNFLQKQLGGLDEAKSTAINLLLKNKSVVVYIDDLDRGWSGRPKDIQRISALLNALRDISNECRGIKFRVALRSDVYFLVRTADESTDKIEGSVVWYTWSNHEVLAMLVKRIETFFERTVDDERLLMMPQIQLERYLDPIFAPRFQGAGKWENAPIRRVLMTLIRKRPRDLVKLCTLAARETRKRNGTRIETADLKAIFEIYSHGRLQDTVNEYRSELPDIERLLLGMRPTKHTATTEEAYVYSMDSLLKKINDILEQGQIKSHTGAPQSAQDLARFLYKVNFLTARKRLASGDIQRKYFEENRYLAGGFRDFGYQWEVHPAYRWALEPESIQTVFQFLELSTEAATPDDDSTREESSSSQRRSPENIILRKKG